MLNLSTFPVLSLIVTDNLHECGKIIESIEEESEIECMKRSFEGKVLELQISRVTVSSTCAKSEGVKPKAMKRLVGIRSKPYPPCGIKIHMPASNYELRSRHPSLKSTSPFKDLAKTLPPNSEALIGKRRSPPMRST
ncbi:unnamed protein product [Anisakis simplex]|uniref:Uncharacterized protein n=1 Tax=Anisakis simplex TaxID=6269 RepID=A0A0M3KCB2_ANISI|nr:unnamed protein product [Anisakis simplex]